MVCEATGNGPLLVEVRNEIRHNMFRPVQTLWITAEMVARRWRKDWYGILEIYKYNYFTGYGVPSDLLDTYLERYGQDKAPNSKGAIELTDFKLLPSSHNVTQVWEAFVRMSRKVEWIGLKELFAVFRRTVVASHNISRGVRNPQARNLHILAPVARFDATHFSHFLRAFATRRRPLRSTGVFRAMQKYGVPTNERVWILFARMLARSKESHGMANLVLKQAAEGMTGVEGSRGRVSTTRHKFYPGRLIYTVLLREHVKQRRRPESWDVYYRLRKAGYKLGSDQVLDPIIIRLFRMGRVRPNKRKPRRKR